MMRSGWRCPVEPEQETWPIYQEVVQRESVIEGCV